MNEIHQQEWNGQLRCNWLKFICYSALYQPWNSSTLYIIICIGTNGLTSHNNTQNFHNNCYYWNKVLDNLFQKASFSVIYYVYVVMKKSYTFWAILDIIKSFPFRLSVRLKSCQLTQSTVTVYTYVTVLQRHWCEVAIRDLYVLLNQWSTGLSDNVD